MTESKKDETIWYGVIDESSISLIPGPRSIVGFETADIEEAFAEACRQLQGGSTEVAICRVRYYGEDGNGYYGEDERFPTISVDARSADWIRDEPEDKA